MVGQNTSAQPEQVSSEFGLTLPIKHTLDVQQRSIDTPGYTQLNDDAIEQQRDGRTHLAATNSDGMTPFPVLDQPSPSKSRPSFTSSRPSTGVDPNNPLSPFYSHPPTSIDFKQDKASSRKSSNAPLPLYTTQSLNVDSKTTLKAFTSVSIAQITPQRTRDCQMWPSQEEMKRRDKESARIDKRNRHKFCSGATTWWVNKCNRRMRIMLGLALLIVVLGVVLTIGLVVSKKSGTGYYQSSSAPNTPIGQS